MHRFPRNQLTKGVIFSLDYMESAECVATIAFNECCKLLAFGYPAS